MKCETSIQGAAPNPSRCSSNSRGSVTGAKSTVGSRQSSCLLLNRARQAQVRPHRQAAPMTSAAHCQAPSPATTWLGRTGTGRRCRTCVLAVDGVRPGVARAAATCCESCGAPSAAFLAFASSTHGDSQVLNLRKPVGGWAWRIHVLSATSTATNQNAWIDVMKQTLGQPQYAPLNLVDVVYGNDDDQTSQQQVQGLLQSYPNLHYVAAELVQREITGTPGEKFSVPTPGRLHHWRQQRHPAGAAPGLRQQQHRPVQVLTVVSFATPRRSSSTRSRSQRPLARARLSPG